MSEEKEIIPGRSRGRSHSSIFSRFWNPYLQGYRPPCRITEFHWTALYHAHRASAPDPQRPVVRSLGVASIRTPAANTNVFPWRDYSIPTENVG